MNILDATANEAAANQIYNVALSISTSLNELYSTIHSQLAPRFSHLKNCKPVYRDFRAGDVRHSIADISKARQMPGYEPTHLFENGLKEAMDWYVNDLCGDIASRRASPLQA